MPFNVGLNGGPLTDKSGSASTTSAQVAAQNTFRSYFFFQNLDATIVMYVNFGAAASATNSYKVIAGGTLEFRGQGFIPTDAVNVVSASGTPAYCAKEG